LLALLGLGFSQQPREVVVGFSLPLTGAAANEGIESRVGAELAVRQINARGGVQVGGQRVTFRLVFEDDQCNPQAGTEAATRLAAAGARFVGGSFCSGAALAQMPVLGALGVPQIVYAYADALTGEARRTGGANLAVRIGPQAAIEMAPLAKYAVVNNNHRRFFAMGQNSDFGRSMVAQFRRAAEALGGSFVAEPDFFPFAATDFRSILTRARASGADAIVAIGLAQEMIGITLQRDELGITLPVYGSDLLEDRAVINAVAGKSAGFYAPWFFDTGVDDRRFAGRAPEAGALALEDAALLQLGQRATRNHGWGWGTIMLLAQAMERTGSTDPQVVMQEVLSGRPFQMPFGNYGFLACGQADMRAGVSTFDAAGRRILLVDRDYAGLDPAVLRSADLCP
jgi:branched-chain amino acid transport system substrate-binding protein